MGDPRQDVTDACRVLASAGQGDLIWGHVGIRDPDGRGVWIKRRGIGLEEVSTADVHLVNELGEVIEGDGEPHAEVHIHSQVLKSRDDVNVVVHTHALAPVVLAAAGMAIAPVSHEGSYFCPPGAPTFTETGRLITTPELGRRVAHRLGDAEGMVLRNHGTATVGVDVAHAVMSSLLLERASQAQMMCAGARGQPVVSSLREAQAKKEECYSNAQIQYAWAYLLRKESHGQKS